MVFYWPNMRTESLSSDEIWPPRVSCIYRGAEKPKNPYWYLDRLCLYLSLPESLLRIYIKSHFVLKTAPQSTGQPQDIIRVETGPFLDRISSSMGRTVKWPPMAECDQETALLCIPLSTCKLQLLRIPISKPTHAKRVASHLILPTLLGPLHSRAKDTPLGQQFCA